MLNLAASSLTNVAYLDGGTGSLIVQSLIAGALTGAYFIKSSWAVIVAKVTSRKSSSK